MIWQYVNNNKSSRREITCSEAFLLPSEMPEDLEFGESYSNITSKNRKEFTFPRSQINENLAKVDILNHAAINQVMR